MISSEKVVAHPRQDSRQLVSPAWAAVIEIPKLMCLHIVEKLRECGVTVATAGWKPAAYKRRAGSIPATRTNAPVM